MVFEKTKHASVAGNAPTDQVSHLVNHSVLDAINGTSDDAGQTRQQLNKSKGKEVAQQDEQKVPKNRNQKKKNNNTQQNQANKQWETRSQKVNENISQSNEQLNNDQSKVQKEKSTITERNNKEIINLVESLKRNSLPHSQEKEKDINAKDNSMQHLEARGLGIDLSPLEGGGTCYLG